MRKILKIIIVAAFMLTIGLLTFMIFKKYQYKEEIQASIQILPDIEFYSFNGKPVNINSFDPTKQLVIIYFHYNCEHCHYEAQEIVEHANNFRNTQLLMIAASDSVKRIEEFCLEHNLQEVDALEVLIDREFRFEQAFGKSSIPTVFIYNQEKQLKKKFSGETQMKAILSEINHD